MKEEGERVERGEMEIGLRNGEGEGLGEGERGEGGRREGTKRREGTWIKKGRG